jgi:serine/threonine protein kinase
VRLLRNGPSDAGGEDSLSPGAAIGRYIVVGLVGRGSMGEVYAAHDPELNRKVALKLLRARAGQGNGDERARLLLMREAQSIARLSHPNVVVIHDVGRVDDTVFIAMEFVEGHTVRYWLLAEERPWREVVKIFLAAGAGLVAAHENELVHRDFKPDNVMIRTDGQVRVMDFGLARTITRATTPPAHPLAAPHPLPLLRVHEPGGSGDLHATRVLGTTWTGRRDEADVERSAAGSQLHDSGLMVGTPAYMAPEQFQGGRPDARSDQFSFCVALYEALYGDGPFSGNTLQERAASVNEGRVAEAPLHTHVPSWIRKVLQRGLAVDPDARWPSMRALLSRFDENARRLAEIDEWLAQRGAGQAD